MTVCIVFEERGKRGGGRPTPVIIFVYVTLSLLMPAISAQMPAGADTLFLQILKYRFVPFCLPAVKTNKTLSDIYQIPTVLQ